MSDSVRPHRWQPTRLPHPWDFQGKNTGVGCRFLLQQMKVKSESEVAQPCLTLSKKYSQFHHNMILLLLSHFSRVRLCATPETAAPRLPGPWASPGKNTRVGCHFFLQRMKVKSENEVAQPCPTLSDPLDCSPSGSSIRGIFPGKSTGVECHFLLHPRP